MRAAKHDMTQQDAKDDKLFKKTIGKARADNPQAFRRTFINDQIAIYGGDEASVLDRVEKKFVAALADLITSHTPAGAEDYMRKQFNILTGRD